MNWPGFIRSIRIIRKLSTKQLRQWDWRYGFKVITEEYSGGNPFVIIAVSHPCYKTQLSRPICNRYWQYNWGYNWVFVHHSYSNYTVNLHCALKFYQLMVISSRQYYGTHHIGSLFFGKWLWPVEDCLEKLTLWQAERGKKIQALISIIKL